MGKIRWGVGAVAVVAAGALAFTVLGSDSEGAGGCGRIERVDKGTTKYRAVDCRSDEANVRVAKVVERGAQCPGDGKLYTTFTNASTLCLMPNFVEGSCYHGDRTAGIKKVDCTAAKALRVVRAGERRDCEKGKPLTYPEPAVTFCLAPAAG